MIDIRSGALRSSAACLGLWATTLAIFIVDTLTELDIAVAVLYVLVIMIAMGSCTLRGLRRVALICGALTLAGFFVSHLEHPFGTALARCLISLTAIGIATWLAVKNRRTSDELQEQLSLLAHTHDVEAQLHRAQLELAHISRNTTMGEMAASIAHEVNQPLAAIASSAESASRWLDRPIPDLDEARVAIKRAASNAHRASEVIRRIRNLTRKSDSHYEDLDLESVVADSLALLDREIQSQQVQLLRKVEGCSPKVSGDRIQLQQVLINLIMNSLQAMTGRKDLPRELHVRIHGKESLAVVEVRDNGPGIDPQHLALLFDAFFTTKEDGMGIGLSICRSIIELHGGRIWADSQPDGGAIFSFSLPASTTDTQRWT
ncbi:Adaptive-response sensory-kinase SasA [Pseudomonas fluorescens]|uniref:histidine kinase n=1 Tax=Pseudomonas fluorescens TaxID=294 RepID=A0A5E7QZW6_PSEFL|nr:ATP-binding protein [Pseudomonas fluorescens]VVP67364.1 Adaptive-response sensory-kinase SasA [Pseudomonas fluorescens]